MRERPLYEIEQIRANLMMLYQYARGFERGGFKGLSGFISFINEVIADKKEIGLSQFASPGEVVTIMTIHQSKGLEFPNLFCMWIVPRIQFQGCSTESSLSYSYRLFHEIDFSGMALSVQIH